MDVNLPAGEARMPVRVLIVDDQEPFRLTAVAAIETTDGFEVVGADHYAAAAAESGAIGYLTKTALDPDGLAAVWTSRTP